MNNAVIAYREALLAADVDRVGTVDAFGLDEALYFRKGTRHTKQWATSVDGGPGRHERLVEMIRGHRHVGLRLDRRPAFLWFRRASAQINLLRHCLLKA
jgi:hypothetical protein